LPAELQAQRGQRGQREGSCQSVSSDTHATIEWNWEPYVRRRTLDDTIRGSVELLKILLFFL
jgi:hypothetical protein